MSTPKSRSTRSNSNSNTTVSLQDIHNLLSTTRTELMSAMKNELEKINKSIACLTEKVTGLESRLDAFDSKQRKQEQEIADIKESLKELKKQDNKVLFEEICDETTARWRKRKYLIVSGIAEHTSGNLSERKKKDIKEIERLAEELDVEDIEIDECEISRVGRLDSDRPRLLRFKCDDADARRQLLKNSKNLRKSHQFQNVYINPDLTHFQRKRNTELRKEVKRRREGGENVGIRRGRIVDLNQNSNFH